MIDVLIIGAGVIGSAVARELSRYKGDFLLVERDADVCSGTSKANSGIVHGGYDAKPGSLKATLNVAGNKAMKALSQELDFPFKQIGSLVVATSTEDIPKLEALLEQGKANGVENLQVITDIDQLRSMEPNLNDQVVAALHCADAGIVCPFSLNVALAENAVTNGVKLQLNTEVVDIKPVDGHYEVTLKNHVSGQCEKVVAKSVVNCSGVYGDVIHNMVSADKMTIVPRKGEYHLLDNRVGDHVNHTVFMLPNKWGKGVLVSPTVAGNLIVGPTADDIEDKEGVDVTADALATIREKSAMSVKNVPFHMTITTFAGLRAHHSQGDFIIEEVSDAPRFFDCVGIESPGLSSCYPIGQMMSKMVAKSLNLEENKDFNGSRKAIKALHEMTLDEVNKAVAENPSYGKIVCRCQSVTEAEIVEAIHRPIPALTVDGIKRRVHASFGRCQGGFCLPKIMEIISRETGLTQEEITKKGPGSNILVGDTKEFSN